jgi:hypothetical protein
VVRTINHLIQISICLSDTVFFSLAKYENVVHTLRLPPVDDLVGLETYLELLCEDLGYCENLISTVADVNCKKCVANLADHSIKPDTCRANKRKGINLLSDIISVIATARIYLSSRIHQDSRQFKKENDD